MEKEKIKKIFIESALAATALAASAALAILFPLVFLLEENKIVIENELKQTRESFSVFAGDLLSKISGLEKTLKQTERELAITSAQRDHLGLQYNDAMEKYLQEKARMDDLHSQVGQIQGSVQTLEKLKTIDPELLKKYSKIYFLNENYVPESLAKIDSEYVFNPEEDYLFHAKAWPFLKVMLAAAVADGVDIKIVSAYRSFGEQTAIKASYKVVYGSGANQFSADQGYSEHQLGTTIDFTDSEIGASFSEFEKTEAYRWLENNAYQYGFVLSYPESNRYYQYEPWHWRFVGRDLAQKLRDEGEHFYDLDQRDIDEYLISFFD